MFTRVTHFRCSPDQLDQLINVFEQELVPAVNLVPGNTGAVLLVDRANGGGRSITQWDSAENMQASEEAVRPLRDRSAEAGAQLGEIERFEMVIQERAGPPRANGFVRVNDFQPSATGVDEAITFARERILPVLKAQPGFRANMVGVNRETGRIMASSVWDTAADREASEAVVRELRQEAGRLTSAHATVHLYESAVVVIKQAATV
jgi:heme-degrading monooxygenase HmoA